ncbi:hypothetical protein F4781DRAFT_13612 [Annulohypoxylon bovei var. microspora]|nr:hypothetical protein F4781DRAFT_13612 [Annulohypoxylon bovei var. microspora]
MAPFPLEIFNNIFSFTTHGTLLNCRLLNKDLGFLATSWAFRHVYLEAAGDMSLFVKISRTPHLRSRVREISISTTLEPDFEYQVNQTLEFPMEFFLALPNLRSFSRLKKLNLKFNEYCGNQEADYTGYDIEENYDFRYWVMWNVFNCLTGEWTSRLSAEIYAELNVDVFEEGEEVDADTFFERITSTTGDGTENLSDAIELEALTIGNLAGYDETRLTSSNFFKKVLSTATELKLYVVFENYEASPENAMYFSEPYDFMESLNKTWLAPEIAKNLRVLSLFCDNYWGWIPRMDFRDINPGTGLESGFPKLEVLALGNYIFSHEWQTDWFASLGSQNRQGGLRELYLDDCPILRHARFFGKLDETPGSIGYPTRESILARQWGGEITQPYLLRWDHILSHWNTNMAALKIFRVGAGHWRSDQSNLVQEAYQELGLEWTSAHENYFNHANFTTYDCAPGVEYHRDDAKGYSQWSGGVGIRGDEDNIALQYIEYDQGIGPTQWMEERHQAYNTDIPKPQPKDVQALVDFRTTIENRNKQ